LNSRLVQQCQICGSDDLRSVLFIGYLPPVNQMHPIGQRPNEQAAYPAEWLACGRCELVQIGLEVAPHVLFPPEYPYRSGTTGILRKNFAQLYEECQRYIPLTPESLIVDVGSNDGTLLSNFHGGGHRVLGIEPTLMANLANERGITTRMSFFDAESAAWAREQHGLATIVTATNVFAHIPDVHSVVDSILSMLKPDGLFISESHYLFSLIETLQYDTIYHEHLRYYSLHALRHLFEPHDLEIVHATRIPTHGGSIRVYTARRGTHQVQPSVAAVLAEERKGGALETQLAEFKTRVVASKLALHALLTDIKKAGHRIFGVGAPSRASTLINYVGLDDGILECVVEVSDSYKLNKYMPGTLIPVVDEQRLFDEQPEYAMFLSWHIGDELAPKLKQRGFQGRFIVPLPEPRILSV
jgi:SAM-dependent methyltransferase